MAFPKSTNYLAGLAALTVSLGFGCAANAQNAFPVCIASVANPFDMRAEGIAEQAGDVIFFCNGGTPTAAGAPIPQVNITVSANTNITSRLLNGTTMVNEALLLINEPNSGAVNGLPTFPIAICPASGNSGANDCPMTGSGSGGGVGRPTYNPAAGGARYNAFQGVLQSADNTQITFFGVPFDPPASGDNMILRITNIRMNAYSLSSQAASGSPPVPAFLSVGSAAFTINNPLQIAGNVHRGLAGQSVANVGTLGQCNSTSAATFPTVETVNFSEGDSLPTATRLRIPTAGTTSLGNPGYFQDTESQFVPLVNPQGWKIGLADAGTRIKVTIGNVPAGVQVYLPTVISSLQTAQGSPLETLQMTATELGPFSAVLASSVAGAPLNFAQVPTTSGVAVAIYEVASQQPSALSTVKNFSVPVAVSYLSVPANHLPGLGTSTARVDFAPSLNSAASAVFGAQIPRFQPSSVALSGFSMNACSSTGGPALVGSPSALSFKASGSQTVHIASTTTGTAFTVSTSQTGSLPWLSASPSSGSAPQDITIIAAVGSLPIGFYSGVVTINVAGSAGGGVAIPVELTVSGFTAVASGTLANATGSPFATGGGPISVAVADFNGDGKADLVTANQFDGIVTVLLGNGSGGFTSASGSPFATGSNPKSVAVGDFNGDGKADLVIANNGSNNVTVLLGNGAGGFTPAPGSPFAAGPFPVTSVVGDFNGDGKMDIATANSGDSTVTLLFGNGSGSFTAAPASITVPQGLTGLTVGDFNGDEKPDLAVITFLSQSAVSLVLGDGNGGFTTLPSGTWTLPLTQPNAIVAGDFNGDGKLDIAAAGNSGVVVVFGDGSGGLVGSTGLLSTSTGQPSSLAAGDFNGDGKLDLAVSSYIPGNSVVSNVSVFLGDGAGGFVPSAGSYLNVTAQALALAAADFNADNRTDLAVANFGSPGAVTVLLGSLVATTTTIVPPSGSSFPAGQAISLGVLVTPATTFLFNTPSGTVTLRDGATVLGSTTLAGSPTTININTLSAGLHSITAAYGGDSRTLGSVSSPLNITGTAVPASIVATGGTGQSAMINAQFASPLQVVVKDSGNLPIAGLAVTFTAPSSGASGSFPTGSTSITNLQGVATSSAFIANGTAGSYTVNATINSVPLSASFSLTNSPLPPAPAVVSVTPNSSTGLSQIFTAKYSSAAGASYLGDVFLLIGTSTSSAHSCFVQYHAANNSLFLYSDSGSSEVGPLTPGASGTLANSQCTVNGSNSSVSNAGNILTFNFALTFSPAFIGVQNIYAEALDMNSQNSGWVSLGTWTPAAGATALRYVLITPCRIADTRNAAGPFGGPSITGQTFRNFVIPNSACGIPATAQAYSLNVVVVPRGPLGFLTLWPAGQPQPLASTLNSDGRIKSNAAIVPAGINGAVSVFATNTTDVVLDISGYFVPATTSTALAFYPLPPCRIADTRNVAGPLGGPFIGGLTTRLFPVRSSACNVPAAAQAYSVNFTVVPHVPLAFLTAYPAGQSQPFTSTLNAPTGAITANAAIVPAGTNGAISVYATHDTDLVVDIDGYFAPAGSGGLSLYNLQPCRVLDSRLPAGTPPLVGAMGINVLGSNCGTPSTAQAYVFNATVVPSAGLGFLTLWPQGVTQPVASTLNASDGAITGNLAIVPTGNGSVSAFATNATFLVMDLFGYFAP